MTVRNRVALVCASQAIACSALGIVALLTFNSTERTIVALTQNSLPSIYSIGKLSGLAKEIRGATRNQLTLADAEQKTKADQDVANYERQFGEELERYATILQTAEDKSEYQKISAALARFTASSERARRLSREKSSDAMPFFRADTMEAYRAVDALLAHIGQRDKADGDRNAALAGASLALGRRWMVGLLVACIVCGALGGFFAARQIAGAMTKSLSQLSNAADQIASAAAQVSSSSQSLAHGASEQAMSVQRVTEAAGAVDKDAKQNAERSRAAAEVMVEAGALVHEANEKLCVMVGSMDAIQSASQKIANIIKVIDEIAFQTNILALNAAVEAARAGGSGLGFAVVADEVRNLAQRCAKAAKDTAELIEDAVARSADGRSRVDEVVAAISSLTASAQRVQSLTGEVSQSSQSQASSVNQISAITANVESVTQRNAAVAEESASAAEELTAQAESLRRIVSEVAELVGS